MRHIDEKAARQALVKISADIWLREHGSRLRLESYFPHRMAVMDRCVQWARWRREKHLLLYGHVWRRPPHRFRRPR